MCLQKQVYGRAVFKKEVSKIQTKSKKNTCEGFHFLVKFLEAFNLTKRTSITSISLEFCRDIKNIKKRAFSFYNSRTFFFPQHFKVVVSVFNRILKFEKLKSIDATIERWSEKKILCNFLKTKVNYLTSTKNSCKLPLKMLIFGKLAAFQPRTLTKK